jgi:hypothetical protein
MNNLKIIQHMFMVVRKSMCSPWGIIPFCKNWRSLLCYGSKLSVCFLWLQRVHSHIPQNSYCNCKPLEWWGSTYLSLPHAVARCCISIADMRKIKSFFLRLDFFKRFLADKVPRYNYSCGTYWRNKTHTVYIFTKPVGTRVHPFLLTSYSMHFLCGTY